MEKREIYDAMSELERHTDWQLTVVKELKEEIEHLIKENQTLQLENEHLRERLEARGTPEKEEHELTRSKMNLEKIYEDGFHVCNLMFGKRREADEPCAFCLEVIYGQRK